MELTKLSIDLLNIVVLSINLIGIAIILWGVVIAANKFIRMKVSRGDAGVFLTDSNQIRSLLGTYILFGLEFMIAADIIHTIIKPTQHDLVVLATIVAIRTVISYFLEREIEAARSSLLKKL